MTVRTGQFESAILREGIGYSVFIEPMIAFPACGMNMDERGEIFGGHHRRRLNLSSLNAPFGVTVG